MTKVVFFINKSIFLLLFLKTISMKNYLLFLCILCALCISCNTKNEHPDHVILTFDDAGVDEWFAHRELFDRYDIKVIFCQ